ncbi:MAG: hypothetical protein HOJ35_04595, partial [Bdellovibrionales bacterium]|nr:hypothetical protein [Bdellovibrionales bacterium]
MIDSKNKLFLILFCFIFTSCNPLFFIALFSVKDEIKEVVTGKKKKPSKRKKLPSPKIKNDPESKPAPVVIPIWPLQIGKDFPNPNPINRPIYDDECMSMTIDSSDNIYCVGKTTSYLGSDENVIKKDRPSIFILKINPSNEIVWTFQLDDFVHVDAQGNLLDTSATDECNDIAVDNLGNVFCAGYTKGDLGEDFGGLADAFIMKLNSEGILQWVTQLGGDSSNDNSISIDTSGYETCLGVTVDSSGNIYCGGETSSDLSESNGGSNDAFVMKLNSLGELEWVTQIGAVHQSNNDEVISSEGYEACMSIEVDSLGNIFCGGYTSGSLGEGIGGGYDVFVMKLNSVGILQWVTQLGGDSGNDNSTLVNASDSDFCSDLALDGSGNVYCSGYTEGSLGETNGDAYDVFVMKLNSSGELQWITQLGDVSDNDNGINLDSSSIDLCNALTVDNLGNSYCAGSTKGSLIEGNGGGSNKEDIIVVKLDSSGTLQWIAQLGSDTSNDNSIPINVSDKEACNGIAVDSKGNIFCSGYTRSNLMEENGGFRDAFVMKINSDQVLQNIIHLGANTMDQKWYLARPVGTDICWAIKVDNDQNIYCAGETTSGLGEKSGGSEDAFVMKINSLGETQWITQIGATHQEGDLFIDTSKRDRCYGLALDKSGNIYCAGETYSDLSESNGGVSDAFV